ncbi:pyruvate kinase [Micrococcus sp. EYE_162]|uniref:pyruvate kinase n=1 Tax=unclassified Micrococcus TaxID=2620948 RepID=UPI002002CCB5|nr:MULTISPECIES: pyruvate kinase [unclassified Micrococcus]MCK6095977.1 pyruvate kinase [Micrococcus sp. EYE_212]MCK6172068.1 pyruvate kinase [Micrococcus sp. EYE_162]
MTAHLVSELTDLRERLLDAEAEHAALIERVRERHRPSARNLVHYVALRGTDLRPLQDALSEVGLSSLGRMEAGVLGHLDAVLRAVRALDGAPAAEPTAEPDDGAPSALTPAVGREILERNANALLGPMRQDRQTRVMVTMPSEAATDPELVRGMAAAGMDLARVNCAHDGEDAWAAMIDTLRGLGSEERPAPRVAMDLAGPKLRTGPLEPGPRVLKVKPSRDDGGQVLEPSRVWLGAAPDGAGEHPAGDGVVVPLQDPDVQVLAALEPGDEVDLKDARGSRRTLMVERVSGAGLLVSTVRTVYWETGMRVDTPHGPLTVGELPPLEQSMRVQVGEDVVLTRSMQARPAVAAPPYRIGCSLEQAFRDVSVGDRVWIDDGRIGGEVTANDGEEITLTVTNAGPAGAKLKAEKGINFPDTALEIPALTAEDLSHIPFVASHADMVNMSFVRSAADVARLIEALEEQDAKDVDVTLKIETVAAFEQLPLMLLEAMRWNDVGVMIARGDLAVEAGFERMAELQEEILWLCEAAHVPAIWATQILESLAKKGLPSRAEITDAAMAQRAEAAMLNKGPYIEDAITSLGDILARMGGHTRKKGDMLRRLESWSL